MSAFFVLAEEEEVIFMQDQGAVRLSLSASQEDGQVRLYTYTIKDADGQIAGKVELRYGKSRSSYGKILWIQTNQTPIEIKEFRVREDYLEISMESWKSFFTKERYTYQVSEEVLESIPIMAGVKWEGKGTYFLNWDWDSNQDLEDRIYLVTLYLNDEAVSWTNIRPRKQGYRSSNFSFYINESGTYKISIKAIGESKTLGDSEELYSEVYEYVRPSQQLPAIKELRWRAKEGEALPTIIEWDPEAIEYVTYDVKLEVYRNGKRQGGYGRKFRPTDVDLTKPLQFDLTTLESWPNIQKYMGQEGIEFVAIVTPISTDIEVIANGEATKSEEFKVYNKVNEVKEDLADTTAESVLKDVEKAGIENVAVAMQTDEEFLNQMEKIEQEYMAAHENIKVEKSVEHSALFGDIKVVGAAMNSVSGGAVTLNFKEVPKEQEKEVNSVLYSNPVQINIDITGDVCDKIKEEKVLAAPITVTMYPPKGVLLSRLVILHYHSDGQPERIYPVFRADGKITFSVTKFSTFVFAEMALPSPEQPSNPSNPSNPSDPSQKPDNDNDDDDDDDDNSSSSNTSNRFTQGIQNYSTGKRFIKPDGSVAKSEWINKDGKWYYAGADGILKTGWYRNAAGVWYYLQGNCEMATNWQQVNGKWYYLDSKNGDMKTSWLQTADGKWYYLNPKNGDMAEGWQLVNGKWYYLNPKSGEMATGWKNIGGKWYFLSKSGECLLNTITPDGYQVDQNGAWIP